LRYRGHLDILSNNTYIGAINAENDKANSVKNQLTGQHDSPPTVARYYKANGLKWYPITNLRFVTTRCVVGESNFGEGSARESAAVSPRYLGCAVIIVKSFARIHETNLKKQVPSDTLGLIKLLKGILPLTFTNESDYDLITADTRISVDIQALAPSTPISATLKTGNNSRTIQLHHSLNERQLCWFKAGGALNLIKSKNSETC